MLELLAEPLEPLELLAPLEPLDPLDPLDPDEELLAAEPPDPVVEVVDELLPPPPHPAISTATAPARSQAGSTKRDLVLNFMSIPLSDRGSRRQLCALAQRLVEEACM
jgi:hypothetical protein